MSLEPDALRDVSRVPRPAGLRRSRPAPLPRSHFLLRWTPAGPGARYDVTVATIELRPLHEATALLAPELLVPEAALASVPSGGTVIFIVKARLADGRQAAAVAFEARVQ